MLKILVISQSAWIDSTSFGNTFTNFFSNWDNSKIAHIYTDTNFPDTNCCLNFFNICENRVIKSIVNRNIETGYIIQQGKASSVGYKTKEFKLISYLKSHFRLQIFLWIREVFWCLGSWKTKELNKFIDDFEPDIIFLTFSTTFYINRIHRYVIKFCQKPVVMYTADDGYTLKQFSLSIFFWVDRIIKRPVIRKTIGMVNTLYVISQKQMEEYNKVFGGKCKLLYKWYDFKKNESYDVNSDKPIKLIYTGNLNCGRWKTLVWIGKIIDKINTNNNIAEIEIYTQTPCTWKMKRKIANILSLIYKGYVTSDQITTIQKSADILIHCESFSLKNSLQVRFSFSTKIVDYFSRNRCIFATGNKTCASINYLINNDAAVVAINKNEIISKLIWLLEDRNRIKEYAEKAWNCGKQNHQSDTLQKKLYEELESLTMER